jgi:hypothetical protein
MRNSAPAKRNRDGLWWWVGKPIEQALALEKSSFWFPACPSEEGEGP